MQKNECRGVGVLRNSHEGRAFETCSFRSGSSLIHRHPPDYMDDGRRTMKKKSGNRRVLAAVALVAALANGCAGRDAQDNIVDAGGSLVSQKGQIAFTRITHQNGTKIESDIYLTNVGGTEEERLTQTPRDFDGMPAWSPDGERLAFVSDRDGGNWEIYVMEPDGTGQRRLTNSPHDEGSLAWSPDGEKLAFATDPAGDPAIWVMNSDGSDRKRLTDGLFPTWSPDGSRIAYTDYYGERPYLAVMNADGSNQRGIDTSLLQKVLGIDVAEEPSWAPYGERIAYASYVGADNEEIFVIDVDGSKKSRLTDLPGNDHWPPTWSPDGERIAFTSNGKEGKGQIYAMNADGSGLTRLTEDPADDIYPDWRP